MERPREIPATNDAPNPAHTYLQALGPGSRRTIEQSLRVVAGLLSGGGGGHRDDQAPQPWQRDAREFAWAAVTGESLIAIRRTLADRYAPSTTNKILAAVRGVMRVCRDLGLVDEAQYQSVARVDAVKDIRRSEGRVLAEAELARLFASCVEEGTAAGRRDAALLAIFLSTGLRREEGTELNADDYDPVTGDLCVRSEIAERERTVTLGERARQAIGAWIEARGEDPGPLLLPVDKGGTIRFRRLTAQAVYGIVGRAAERAGLEHVTTRDLRRTCIVRLILAGLDIEQVRQRAGHLSWLTTAAYEVLAGDAARLDSDALPYAPPPAPSKGDER